MNKSIRIVTIFLCCIIGCKNQAPPRAAKEAIDLHPVESINAWGDSVYVDCEDIISQADGYVVINGKRLLILDSMRQIRQILGREGKGPAEYLFPTSLASSGNILIVFDNDNKKIVRYLRQDSGKYIYVDEIAYPKGTHMVQNQAVVYKDEFLFVPTPFAKTGISKINLKDAGNTQKLKDQNTTTLQNGLQLVIDEQDRLVSVRTSEALVEVNDLAGNTLFTHDIAEDIPEVDVIKRVAELFYQKHNDGFVSVTVHLIMDTYYKHNCLYLLIRTYPEEIDPDKLDLDEEIQGGKHIANKILKYQLEKDRLVLDKVFRLYKQEGEKPNLLGFAVNDQGEILAFDWKNTLYRYKMEPE